MKSWKKYLWLLTAVLVLFAGISLLEKHIYESSIYSLPLFNSDGSVGSVHNRTEDQKICITYQGQETEFRGVNADFMCFLTLGDRRILFSAPEVSGECISV